MKISTALFIPLQSPSRLQQLLYNQVIITSLRDTIDVEIFDRSTFLTELYEVHNMLPMHFMYFIILLSLIYLQKDMLQSISTDMIQMEKKYMKEPYQKSDILVKDAYSLRRIIRSVLFVFLFIFTKDVDHVS
jgi:hypothetical protein